MPPEFVPNTASRGSVPETLGLHEIATVQTTAIDATTGTVSLTTVLALGLAGLFDQ